MAKDFFYTVADDTDMHAAISTQIHSLTLLRIDKVFRFGHESKCEVNIHSLVIDRPLSSSDSCTYPSVTYVSYTSKHISACELAQMFIFS